MKTFGWSPTAAINPSRSSGRTGAELKPTVVRLTMNTITPESAESPASISIEPRTRGVSRMP